MKRLSLYSLFVAGFALLASCATTVHVADPGQPCEADGYAITDNFVGARRGKCRVVGGDDVTLEILPEDAKVKNPSPWFAFRIEPEAATDARITLDYGTWKHRYRPKISYDGLSWSPLDESSVEVSADSFRASLDLELDGRPVWVAAQELVVPAIYEVWNQKIAERTDAQLAELGKSRFGLPIWWLDTNSDSKDIVMLIGRQHPPEVSGSFAFFSFFETLHADTDLAMAFRDRYRIVSIPLLNPDGVASGNWRHNLGEVDLNRDWGVFTQPETQLVAGLLDELDKNGGRLRVFLDFHSTDRNLFYTQVEADVTDPPGFAETWFGAVRPRLKNYEFTNEARPLKNPAVGKNYIYKRYGIPTFTYEVGDETDRKAARAAAVVFAEEFMKLMLSL